jgi:hypothetical protein
VILSDENLIIADWMLTVLACMWDAPSVDELATMANQADDLQWVGPNLGVCRRVAQAVLLFREDSRRPLTEYMAQA